MMRTSSLLPSGSPFGDFGPHRDSLQFLVPIFFHIPIFSISDSSVINSPPFFCLYYIDFKLIAHKSLNSSFNMLFGKIQFRNDLLKMIFLYQIQFKNLFIFKFSTKFNSKIYSYSSFSAKFNSKNYSINSFLMKFNSKNYSFNSFLTKFSSKIYSKSKN